MRYFFIFFLSCCFCAGQSVTLGVIGGGRTTNDMGQGATPASRFYDIGPMAELGLPFGFAIEVDAIYHRHGYEVAFNNPLGGGVESERANSWEFPMLVKYRLPFHGITPFVELGGAPRTISGTISNVGRTLDVPTGVFVPFSNTSKTSWSSSVGLVAGGGVQFGIGRLRLSPEVRYTYWKDTPIILVFGDGPTFYSSQNQFDVLLCIGWKLR
jgi:hypothetical protein